MYKFLVILIIVISACNTSKAVKETSINQIKFGSGGGVTGEVNGFTLNDDGKLLNKNQTQIAKVKKAELVELFHEGKSLLSYELNSPQNMYYFIEIYGLNDTNRLIWGLESRSIDEKVQKLYQKLNSKIKSK